MKWEKKGEKKKKKKEFGRNNRQIQGVICC